MDSLSILRYRCSDEAMSGKGYESNVSNFSLSMEDEGDDNVF